MAHTCTRDSPYAEYAERIDACAYSDDSSEEDDQLDHLESDDLVPASSSPVSSSPIAATQSNAGSAELVPVIYNRHGELSGRLYCADGGSLVNLDLDNLSDDDEKVTALLEVEDQYSDGHISPNGEVEPHTERAELAPTDVNIPTESLALNPLFSSPTQSSFVIRLNELLQEVQKERSEAEFRRIRVGTPPALDASITSMSDSASDIEAPDINFESQSRTSSVSARSVIHSRTSSASTGTSKSQIGCHSNVVSHPFSRPRSQSACDFSQSHSPSHFETSPSPSSDYWACFRFPDESFPSDGWSEPDEGYGAQDDIEDFSAAPPAYIQPRSSNSVKEEEPTPRSIVTSTECARDQPPIKTSTQLAKLGPQTRSTFPAKRQFPSSNSPIPLHSVRSRSKPTLDACTQSFGSDKAAGEPAAKRRKLSLRESRYFTRRRFSVASADSGAGNIACGQGTISAGKTSLQYAQKPGTLRRAESLRSELSSHEDTHERIPALHPSHISAQTNSSGSATPTSNVYAYVPTEPSTPVTRSPQLLASPLPIVAPPPFALIPREPLSGEEAAERRLRVLLEKEQSEREGDGLPCGRGICRDAREGDDVMVRASGDASDGEDDVDEERSSCAGACFGGDEAISEAESEEATSQGHTDGRDGEKGKSDVRTRESRFDVASKLVLGLEDDLRRETIEWILDVLPPVIPTKRNFCTHLHDQLSTSDETRFHAAHLFTRYFLRVGRSPESSPAVTKRPSEESDLECEGRRALAWDVALACLALCVKFHRDALFPLYIVLASEFMAIAPHALTTADLESAQRDVLEALSFTLGSTTPAAFMQELWHALPSLRALLAFDGGWAGTQAETWAVLLEALLEPDVLRFPVSLLTAAALLDGVEEALVQRRSVQARSAVRYDPVQIRKGAMRASRTVELDVLELLGYAEEDLACCRRWLRAEGS